jgi:hypothetical protein
VCRKLGVIARLVGRRANIYLIEWYGRPIAWFIYQRLRSVLFSILQEPRSYNRCDFGQTRYQEVLMPRARAVPTPV